MKYSFDLTGAQIEQVRNLPIATTTAIKEGQLVKLVGNLVVACAVDDTAAIVGVAKENHPGTADPFNTRSNGTEILVSCSPTAVFAAKAVQITVTTGGTTTFVASAIAVFTNDDFNGGFVKLVAKGASSTNPNAIGTIMAITDFVAASKTFTVAETVISVGDVFELYPPIGFTKGNFNTAITNVVLTANATIPVAVYGYAPEVGEVLYNAALHTYGNKKA